MILDFRLSPYFILSTLVFMYSLQRISSIDLFGMSLAPADIFLLFSVLFFSKIISIKHLIFSISFCIFLILIALINDLYAINSIITVSLKIYFAVSLISLFDKVTPTNLDYRITYFYFFLLILILIIFSENNLIFNYSLMNPNEGVNYLIALWALLSIIQFKRNDRSFLHKNIYILLPGLFILLVSAFLFTRQGLISLTLFFWLYALLNKNISLIKKAIFTAPLIIIIVTAIIILQSLGDYESQRIETLLTFDASTRSDQKRLDLIEYGINGFLYNPMGNGLSSFQANNLIGGVAHNFYISSMYELGLIGIFFIGLIVFKAIKNIFNSRRQEEHLTLIINLICTVFLFQLLFIEGLGKIGVFLISGWVLFYSKSNSLQKPKI